jgi:hypothetical protein
LILLLNYKYRPDDLLRPFGKFGRVKDISVEKEASSTAAAKDEILNDNLFSWHWFSACLFPHLQLQTVLLSLPSTPVNCLSIELLLLFLHYFLTILCTLQGLVLLIILLSSLCCIMGFDTHQGSSPHALT